MEEVEKRVKELFDKGEIEGFLAYKNGLPYLFTKEEELKIELPEGRYPLPLILKDIQREKPQEKVGILVRGCDERHLIELVKNNMVDLERVVFVGVSCSREQAEMCRCEKPYPERGLVGEKTEGVKDRSDLEEIERMEEEGDRFSFWMKEFERCIKCFGCRDICPQCFCETCVLEDENLIGKGKLPPDIPSFHLVRAVHMAGRCVDCGLCEEACPALIPLRTLYRKVREVVREFFGYEPGASLEEKEPFGYLGDGEFEIPEKVK